MARFHRKRELSLRTPLCYGIKFPPQRLEADFPQRLRIRADAVEATLAALAARAPKISSLVLTSRTAALKGATLKGLFSSGSKKNKSSAVNRAQLWEICLLLHSRL